MGWPQPGALGPTARMVPLAVPTLLSGSHAHRVACLSLIPPRSVQSSDGREDLGTVAEGRQTVSTIGKALAQAGRWVAPAAMCPVPVDTCSGSLSAQPCGRDILTLPPCREEGQGTPPSSALTPLARVLWNESALLLNGRGVAAARGRRRHEDKAAETRRPPACAGRAHREAGAGRGAVLPRCEGCPGRSGSSPPVSWALGAALSVDDTWHTFWRDYGT